MVKLTADEGNVYTNGETYGKEICLPDNAGIAAWKQIDESEAGKGPMKYSARSILRELRALSKYDAFRQLLTQIGYDWEFLSANYLAEDDEDFKRLKSSVVEAGIVGSMTEIDTMLAKCIWTAE